MINSNNITLRLVLAGMLLLPGFFLNHSYGSPQNELTGRGKTEPAPENKPAAADPGELHAQAFMATVRHAFEGHVWGDFSGRVQHRSPRAQISTDIAVAVQIEAPQFMRARIILHRDVVYDVIRRLENEEVKVEKTEPREPGEVTMSELGMETKDLLFAFLYWHLLEEEEMESVRGRPCRVMLLQEPESLQKIRVWFSQEHLAPLRIVWLHDGKPQRTLEMTDFASRRGVWYVKSFLLTGDDWQTRVRFTDGSLFAHEHRRPPRNLFPAR